MKKLFFVLLGLCFVGAAALFWLMQSAPVPSVAKSEVPHGESHAEEGDAHGEHGGEASDHASAETHAAPAAAAEHGAAHGEAVEHAAPVAEAKPAVHAPEAGLLSLATEPVDAEVLVDGQSVGRTPFRLKVEGGMKKVELVAEGFETYAREVPADATSGGAATWKVQLKPVKGAHATPPSRPAPAAAPKAAAPKASAHAETHAPAPAPKSSAAPAAASAPATPAGEPSGPMAKGGDVYMRGDLGRWFVQLKSLPRDGSVPDAAVTQAVLDFRQLTGKDVRACKVDLMAKGAWTRLLIGPFPTKGTASALVSELRARLPDGALVAGAQSCLP